MKCAKQDLIACKLLDGFLRIAIESEITGKYGFAIVLQGRLALFAVARPIDELLAATRGNLRPISARMNHAVHDASQLRIGHELEDRTCLDPLIVLPSTFGSQFLLNFGQGRLFSPSASRQPP